MRAPNETMNIRARQILIPIKDYRYKISNISITSLTTINVFSLYIPVYLTFCKSCERNTIVPTLITSSPQLIAHPIEKYSSSSSMLMLMFMLIMIIKSTGSTQRSSTSILLLLLLRLESSTKWVKMTYHRMEVWVYQRQLIALGRVWNQKIHSVITRFVEHLHNWW